MRDNPVSDHAAAFPQSHPHAEQRLTSCTAALQPLSHELTPCLCKLAMAHLHQNGPASRHSQTSPQGKRELAPCQGPGRAAETESAVCGCLPSTWTVPEQPAQPPQEHAGRQHIARCTRARAHTQLSSGLAFLLPFPKPNSDHLLKYFCKLSLFQEGPGAEFSCLYSVWHFSSAYHFSIQAISFKLSTSFEEPGAPMNLHFKFLGGKKGGGGIKKTTAAQVMHTFSC